ncbi:beta-ketoacyl synthase N-terminal-like domain-containing protein [Streptomyces sp. NBC_00094]|uniref:beta-ketoacyl synthase N-terminal-like domain-containing protein n=1 Tax=Streptomyces sp. NBC_00094 TaxID=2903620 RepID=UPI0022531E85|nr:beta-ketoacyl synthase N-terminal-like domain-containing protein [Streptomyces sp. NBC_00094]MCX5391933.1 hypothetical protein [Streptomyces sp. NBC_00094]
MITGTGLITPDPGGPVTGLPEGAKPSVPAPSTQAFQARSFDAVEELGRRTARFNHRTTLLTIAACGAALRDAGVEVTEANREQIGVTVGTFCGSVSGSVDFGWDTYAQPRPAMVNAAALPNLVINAAAGAAAIHLGLRGANTTVTGGPIAGISALRHSAITVRAGHVDMVLAGATEEFGSHEAWVAAAARPAAVPGEAAAVLVVESSDTAEQSGRRPLARVAATHIRTLGEAGGTSGTDGTGAVREQELTEVVSEALRAAGVEPHQVVRVALRVTGVAATDAAVAAVARMFPVPPDYIEDRVGDTHAAHAAVQLVETVRTAVDRRWSEDDAGVVIGVDPDGVAAVAVLTGPPAAAAR